MHLLPYELHYHLVYLQKEKIIVTFTGITLYLYTNLVRIHVLMMLKCPSQEPSQGLLQSTFVYFRRVPPLLSALVCWAYHNKIPQTRGLNNRNLFPQSSGGWKSKVKVRAGWFVLRFLFLAGRWPLPHCDFTWLLSLVFSCVS